MATSYSTPGVYVEEITKFPPSVAPVQTAIPAFIGFTEIAKKKTDSDLLLKPTRITSMLEYETFFGFAKPETDITVSVTGNEVTVTAPGANKSPYLMYYSLQLFFANGGGPCYITSVGEYGSATPLVDLAALKSGLDAVRKQDEPTLLLFPDASSLPSDSDFYAIYKDALTQCQDLQDRFTIIDTYSDEEYDTALLDGNNDPYVTIDPIPGIRAGISGTKDLLKYGATYFPYLETILDYALDESQIMVTDTNVINYDAQVQAISDAIDLGDLSDLLQEFVDLTDAADAGNAAAAMALRPDLRNKVAQIMSYITALKGQLEIAIEVGRTNAVAPNNAADPTIVAANALDTWITNELETLNLALSTRIDDINGAANKTALMPILFDTSNPAIESVYETLGIDTADIENSTVWLTINAMKDTGNELDDLITELAALSSGGPSVSSLSSIAASNDLLYNKIKMEIGLIPVTLPPSSAIAGIYASVDRNNGVWKAPANVGLNYVIKPTVAITNQDQESMNIDQFGKSVNAIRSFTGKGVLVWGARTMAGNDNEWRYVSVRRFFNMAEESIRKASEQFVFESNDANTWVRVRAMIENFLTLQWRAGALAGAKPDQAFYVRVGLGQTMTAEDILNGYMNIEIGMAVVRPAEFIVLKFSHKMQEA